MINGLTVRHFQSLDDVDLTLGSFTAIVGPSSSGKSALVRAVRSLVGNMRGTSAVTRGAATLAVVATVDGGFVKLQRGKVNDYELGVDPWAAGNPRFTKIGTGVPAEITKALGVPADGGLSFAGQFDAPFLLSDTGAAVARVLGELTNVDVLYTAAREANRRRLAAAAALKIRQADLAKGTAELTGYDDVELELERHAGLSSRASALASTRTELLALLKALSRVQSARHRLLDQPAQRELPGDESVSLLKEKSQQLSRLDGVLARINTARATLTGLARDEQLLVTELSSAVLEVKAAKSEAALAAATCPTCGSARVHWTVQQT